MDNRLRFMADLTQPLTVPPGSTVKLSKDHDPGYTGSVTSDDVTLRISEAADGADAVRQVLDFARALSAATGS